MLHQFIDLPLFSHSKLVTTHCCDKSKEKTTAMLQNCLVLFSMVVVLVALGFPQIMCAAGSTEASIHRHTVLYPQAHTFSIHRHILSQSTDTYFLYPQTHSSLSTDTRVPYPQAHSSPSADTQFPIHRHAVLYSHTVLYVNCCFFPTK